MDGFQKECTIYGELMPAYQKLRQSSGLDPLPVPKCFLADNENGIIIMENLKQQGFILMSKLEGEGKYNSKEPSYALIGLLLVCCNLSLNATKIPKQ